MGMLHQNQRQLFCAGLAGVVLVALSAMVAVVHIAGWGMLQNEDLEMLLYLFGIPCITGLSIVGFQWMDTMAHSRIVSARALWRSGLGAGILYACLDRMAAYMLLRPGYIHFSWIQSVAVVQWALLVCLQWLITLVVILGIPWVFRQLQSWGNTRLR